MKKIGVLGMGALSPMYNSQEERKVPTKNHEEELKLYEKDPMLFSHEKRNQALDPYKVLKIGLQNLKLIIAFWFISKFLNLKHRWVVIVISLFVKFGAAFPNGPIPKGSPTFFPFLGHALLAIRYLKNPHGLVLKIARESNFQSQELSIPGNLLLLCFDPRDREYVLRKNWRMYLKNCGNSLVDSDVLLAELLGRGIFVTDRSEWSHHRKVASHMFSANALTEKMQRVFNNHSEKFAMALENFAENHQTFDLQDTFTSVIFDGFCEIAFGIDPRAMECVLETGSKPPFLESFDALQFLSVQRLLIPPAIWHVMRILQIGPEAEISRHTKVIHEYVNKIVDDRLNSSAQEEKNDLLSLYLAHAKEHNMILDRDYLKDTILNFMVAGRDTTSSTLTNCFRYLSENPNIEQKLITCFEELHGHNLGWEDAKMMSYPGAFFNEVLRMSPPVPNIVRLCTEDDVLPSGRKIRYGTNVLFPNQSLGRSPDLFDEPDVFNPDRWMFYDKVTGNPLPVRRPDEYVFPVFLGGPRLCLGKDMARLETLIFLKCVLYDHRLRIRVQPGQDLETLSSGPVQFYLNGMKVKATKT